MKTTDGVLLDVTNTAPPLRYAGVSRLTVACEQAHLCEGLNEVVALTVDG